MVIGVISSDGKIDMSFNSFLILFPLSYLQLAELGEKRFENPQTVNLHKVLLDSVAIQDLMAEKRASGEGEGQEGDQEGAGPSGAAGARQKGTRKIMVGRGCWYIFGFSRSVIGQVVE